LKDTAVDNYGEILIYQTEDGLTKIDVNIHDETVWLSIDQMAELFQRDKSTISRHIKNVFEDGNWCEIQLLQILQQLLLIEKLIKSITTILM